MMIGLNRQAQGIATGIDNLSFALETMTRDIRTGTVYNCAGLGDCPGGANSFTFKNKTGTQVTYSMSGSALQKTIGATQTAITDSSVTITGLTFYAVGTRPAPADYVQPHVTVVVSGTVSTSAGKTEPFTIETAATMRGSDI